MRSFVIGGAIVLGLVVVVLLAGLLLLYCQGRQRPVGDPQYVAMGSSFAAGIGLGARAPDSPAACMRTLNGYPQQLAKLLALPLVDVSCSAATTRHILQGGQYFQRAQLDALGRETKLVTITSGGNDISYVGDLTFLAGSNGKGWSAWAMRRMWGGPLRPEQRDFDKVRRDLVTVVAQIRKRSPRARIVLVTYPQILPPSGVCPHLNLGVADADMMREVGKQLADATRAAARESNAVLVDMTVIGAEHHACSAEPWVNGWNDAQGTRYHPTLAGAKAIAAAIEASLRASPTPLTPEKPHD